MEEGDQQEAGVEVEAEVEEREEGEEEVGVFRPTMELLVDEDSPGLDS